MLLMVALSSGVAMIVVLWVRWQYRRIARAKHWPCTEATVETGALELFHVHDFGSIKLPVFAFSYQVGSEYHSGRGPQAYRPLRSATPSLLVHPR